ncbi:hypothetical protein HHX47_DHR2001108 [Lentinula edodes]|nr:hypothetical protein HHX47_DHR2001108 [Lentinula edodes]
MSGFLIRPATPEDAVAGKRSIRIYINRRLQAVYEKAPDAVKATPDLLRQNLFEKQYAHALLAMNGDKPVGLALYFFNYSTWTGRPGLYLEDLYVAPEYRKLGLGKAFFGELGKIAKETWNQPSIDFYEKKLGAKPMSEWLGMRLEEDGIDGLQSLVLEAGPSGSTA